MPPSGPVPNRTLPWNLGKIQYNGITVFKNVIETMRFVKEYQRYLFYNLIDLPAHVFPNPHWIAAITNEQPAGEFPRQVVLEHVINKSLEPADVAVSSSFLFSIPAYISSRFDFFNSG